VEGLVISDEEVRKLMLDREAWRSRIKMIVAGNEEVDSSKRSASYCYFLVSFNLAPKYSAK
jgi:hypothetical protein